MKLCLSCRVLAPGKPPTEHALFCPGCGRSFGVRRCKSCKKKPASPRDATHCIHCGGNNLTEATAYLELGWLVRLISWSFVFLIGRWVWLSVAEGRSTNTTTGASGRTWLDAVLIGAIELCGRILIVGGTLYILLLLVSSVISFVFPGSVSKGFSVLGGSFKLISKILIPLGKFGAKCLFRLVEGKPQNDKSG